ncbi:hypothetical protein JD844_031325 [Phrynosoma platyrhinos]|uniref:Uncharacterized protein n=1 Tax=Phrynosoma platyrhinos TaxID=52577 RepID=A0ABQ7T169_PHRPL|nr:hypothetical protein JD844_031325 [Phrynosoma platyrhinos]
MMSNVLAIGFLAILSIYAAEAVVCLHCKHVGVDNICVDDEKTCESGDYKFCYVKVVISRGRVKHVVYKRYLLRDECQIPSGS